MKKSIFCLFCMIFAVAACGKGSESSMPEQPLQEEALQEEALPQEALTPEASPVSGEADGSGSINGFWEQSAEGDETENSLTFVTGMKIIFPEEWRDRIVTRVEPGLDYMGDSLIVSEKKNAAAGAGGDLFSISYVNHKIALEEPAAPYYIYPMEEVLGVYLQNGGEYAFILSFPREMVWVEGDEAMEKAYRDAYALVDEIQIITDSMEGFTECGKEDLDWIADMD